MRSLRAQIRAFETPVRPGRRLSPLKNRTDAGPGNLATQHRLHGDSLSSANVSRPHDMQERHAEETANRITGITASAIQTRPSPPSGTLHRKAHDAGGTDPKTNIGSGTAAGGHSMPDQARNSFESRFDTDLRHVRIHNDSAAHVTAENLNARAFTQNNHISFAEGQYNPSSREGTHLLAHELAHVTQQTDANKIYRETWNVDDTAREVERGIVVQLLFENTWQDMWSGTGWTPARKNTFRANFESSIENTFNNSNFVLKPPASAIDVLPAENIQQGYRPLVDISLVPDGQFSGSEDWEVDVSSNPAGLADPIAGYRQSSSNQSYGTLNEAANLPVPKASGAPGTVQIPTVHEFGHFIGLQHPGKGLEGGWFSPSRLSPGADVYSHTGTDIQGRTVHGPTDLMGGGMGLRPFYYDAWAQALSAHIEELRSAQHWQEFQRSLDELFSGSRDMGDFPIPETDTPRRA